MKVPQSSAKCHPKAVNWQMLEVIQTSSMLTDSLAISHEAHNGMLRESGDKYITHPFGVAEMYYALNPSDEIGTSASLLHDVVEMSSITLPEIERFLGSIGTQISFIVFNLTKKPLSEFESREARNKEYYSRLFASSLRDIRIGQIKLFDRLQNLLTICCLESSRAQRILNETVAILIPRFRSVNLPFTEVLYWTCKEQEAQLRGSGRKEMR